MASGYDLTPTRNECSKHGVINTLEDYAGFA